MGLLDWLKGRKAKPPAMTPEREKLIESQDEDIRKLKEMGGDFQKLRETNKSQIARMDKMLDNLDGPMKKDLEQMSKEIKVSLKEAGQLKKQLEQKAQQSEQKAQQLKSFNEGYELLTKIYLELKTNDPQYETKLNSLKKTAMNLGVQWKQLMGEDIDIWAELKKETNT